MTHAPYQNVAAEALEEVEERLTSSYFDGVETRVGYVKPWIPAKPLQVLLTKPKNLPANTWRFLNCRVCPSVRHAFLHRPLVTIALFKFFQIKFHSEIGASISRSHGRSLEALERQRQKREQEKLKQQQQRQKRNSKSSSVDQPVGLSDAESKSPLEDASTEKAIQEAVFALASSPKRNSVLWKPLFERVSILSIGCLIKTII